LSPARDREGNVELKCFCSRFSPGGSESDQPIEKRIGHHEGAHAETAVKLDLPLAE